MMQRSEQACCCILLRGCFLSRTRVLNHESIATLHQSMLSLFDAPNTSQVVQCVLVEIFLESETTFNSCWLAFSPETRIPRTYKRFRGLLLQKITPVDKCTEYGGLITVITSKQSLATYLDSLVRLQNTGLQVSPLIDREDFQIDGNGQEQDKSMTISKGTPLSIVKKNFIALSIFDELQGMGTPANIKFVSQSEFSSWLHKLQVMPDGSNKMCLVSVSVSSAKVNSEATCAFLPAIIPSDETERNEISLSGIAISKYKLTPHILCARLMCALKNSSENC